MIAKLASSGVLIGTLIPGALLAVQPSKTREVLSLGVMPPRKTRSSTTRNDHAFGVLIIEVGVAPPHLAEFVIFGQKRIGAGRAMVTLPPARPSNLTSASSTYSHPLG